MPLFLQGIRQVGKTYTLLTFEKEHYKNVADSQQMVMNTRKRIPRDGVSVSYSENGLNLFHCFD